MAHVPANELVVDSPYYVVGDILGAGFMVSRWPARYTGTKYEQLYFLTDDAGAKQTEFRLVPTETPGTYTVKYPPGYPRTATVLPRVVAPRTPKTANQAAKNVRNAQRKLLKFFAADADTTLQEIKRALGEYDTLESRPGFDRVLHKKHAKYLKSARQKLRVHEARMKRLLARFPDKRRLRQEVTVWTDGQMGSNQLLNLYMKRHALRSPQMPPGEFVQGQEPVLYRGIVSWGKDTIRNILEKGVYVNNGYIAVTRDPNVATRFAAKRATANDVTGGLVFKIDARTGIPRGTPWIWYSSAPRRIQQHRNFNRSTYHAEKEVLLPPGRLLIKGAPRQWTRGALVVNAEYVPANGYQLTRRKGAPRNDDYRLPPLFP